MLACSGTHYILGCPTIHPSTSQVVDKKWQHPDLPVYNDTFNHPALIASRYQSVLDSWKQDWLQCTVYNQFLIISDLQLLSTTLTLRTKTGPGPLSTTVALDRQLLSPTSIWCTKTGPLSISVALVTVTVLQAYVGGQFWMMVIRQTIFNIVAKCPLRKSEGGLCVLHLINSDAADWLCNTSINITTVILRPLLLTTRLSRNQKDSPVLDF